MNDSLGEVLRDQGLHQCPLCGRYEEDEQMGRVELDEPGNWVHVCRSCEMSLKEG